MVATSAGEVVWKFAVKALETTPLTPGEALPAANALIFAAASLTQIRASLRWPMSMLACIGSHPWVSGGGPGPAGAGGGAGGTGLGAGGGAGAGGAAAVAGAGGATGA